MGSKESTVFSPPFVANAIWFNSHSPQDETPMNNRTQQTPGVLNFQTDGCISQSLVNTMLLCWFDKSSVLFGLRHTRRWCGTGKCWQEWDKPYAVRTAYYAVCTAYYAGMWFQQLTENWTYRAVSSRLKIQRFIILKFRLCVIEHFHQSLFWKKAWRLVLSDSRSSFFCLTLIRRRESSFISSPTFDVDRNFTFPITF